MIQRNLFFCLLLLIAFQRGYSQNNLSLYQFPQEVPQKYVQNAAYQSARIIASGDPTFTSTELVEFAQRQAYVKRSLFLDGDVYFNWENYEEYLNKVLHNLLPDEYRNDTNLHVYLRRTSNYNAITMHDGTIFFNVGALADIENEAALALILGHEFAHYSNRHIITGYKKELKAKRKSHNYDDYLDKEIENAEYSRSQELMADSIGILLALKAGYDVRYGFNNFYTFMDFKKKDEIIKKAQKMEDDDEEEDEEPVKTKPKTGTRNKANLDKLLASHPDEKVRIEQLERMIATFPAIPQTQYLIDETTFRKLKKDANNESIAIDMEEFNYGDAIERTFVNYLLDTGNMGNLYLLQESIRRHMFMNREMRKKGFLADQYENIFKHREGGLHYLHYIVRDTIRYATIQAAYLADTVYEFENYTEAFQYFNTLARKKNVTESLLSYILFSKKTTDNDSLCNAYSDRYLETPDAQHKSFLEAYRKNTLADGFTSNTKNLLLLSDVSYMKYKHDEVESVDYPKGDANTQAFYDALLPFAEKQLPGYEVKSLYRMSLHELHEKLELYRILQASIKLKDKEMIDNSNKESSVEVVPVDSSATGKKGKGKNKASAQIKYNTNLFQLDPETWEYFTKHDVNSITFLKEYYYKKTTFDFGQGELMSPIFLLLPLIWPAYIGSVASSGIIHTNNSVAMMYRFNPSAQKNNVIFRRFVTIGKLNKLDYLNNAYHILKQTDEK